LRSGGKLNGRLGRWIASRERDDASSRLTRRVGAGLDAAAILFGWPHSLGCDHSGVGERLEMARDAKSMSFAWPSAVASDWTVSGHGKLPAAKDCGDTPGCRALDRNLDCACWLELAAAALSSSSSVTPSIYSHQPNSDGWPSLKRSKTRGICSLLSCASCRLRVEAGDRLFLASGLVKLSDHLGKRAGRAAGAGLPADRLASCRHRRRLVTR